MLERYKPFDSLKGLAIVSVIFIHVTSMYIEKSQLNMIVNQLSRFAVPSFLIISGWGLTIKSENEMKYKEYIYGKVKKLLPPYILWSLIFFAVGLIQHDYNFDLVFMLRGIIFGTLQYHLYYIPVALFFFITYPTFFKIAKSNLGLLIVLIITLLSQDLGVFQIISSLFIPQNVFNWMFYFSFGIWFAQHFEIKRMYLINHKIIVFIFLIVSIVLLFVDHWYVFDVSTGGNIGTISTTSMRNTVVLYSLTIVGLFVSFKISNATLDSLGKYSYGIYLSHPLFLIILLKTESIFKINLPDAALMIINSVVVIVISYFFCYFYRVLYKKIKLYN